MAQETEQQRYRRINNEGYSAFKRGKSNLDNPYWSSQDGDTEAWQDGWNDALDAENELAEMGRY